MIDEERYEIEGGQGGELEESSEFDSDEDESEEESVLKFVKIPNLG